MVSKKKVALAAGIATAVAAVGGIAAVASGIAGADPTANPTAQSTTGYPGDPNGGPGGRNGGPGGAGHQHTTVTGDEAAKVTAAVKAKDAAFTVESVMKDPDGSYDVLGTKNGQKAMYEVSKDLQTITEHTGAPGGKDGGGAAQDTAVTGDEAAKVTAAVKAKDSAFTVESVSRDADGSYDVLGTKNGQKAMYEVSKDLQTITVR